MTDDDLTVADPAPPARRLAATLRDRSSSEPVPLPTSAPELAEAEVEGRLSGSPALRYEVGPLLGSGATSHVWAATDRSFGREVAIKFLDAGLAADPRRLARFFREARITARLEHPNIAPVYDLDATPDGDLYLTMRRITGRSLGEAIRDAEEGRPSPELTEPTRLVNVVLKLCDALACAHGRGILHQDVKPDNIMLGAFGEVVLVDWGAARAISESPAAGRLVGTPLYMSPEQARGEPTDERADLFCLGATVFHALLRRPPLEPHEEGEFWRRKRCGEIDPPTPDEVRRVPPQLLAIVRKAMAPAAADRYPTVRAFADDLAAWQAGLAISAWRDPWSVRVLRWHRRHARTLWLTLVAATAVLGSGWFVYGERLKEVAEWGAPIVVERFDDPGWQQRLAVIGDESRWTVRDGRLVSTGSYANFIAFRQRFTGAVAVEVTAESLPGYAPCDLSLAWIPDDPTRFTSIRDVFAAATLLQVGARDNSAIRISEPGMEQAAAVGERLQPGRRYRLRFEIEDDRFSIAVDGVVRCEHRTAFPATAGWIALYGYYPGKAFDDLAIQRKEVAQRVSPLAVGDHAYRRGRLDEAIEEYRLVAESHPRRPLAQEARFRIGLCAARAGRWEAAEETWRDLPPRLADEAEALRLTRLAREGGIAGVIDRFEPLWRRAAGLHPRLRTIWIDALRGTRDKPAEEALVDRWLDLGDRCFAGDLAIGTAAADALNDLQRWEDVVARYPQAEMPVALALMSLGRIDEGTLERFAGNLRLRRDLLATLGRYEEAGQALPGMPHLPSTIALDRAAALLDDPAAQAWLADDVDSATQLMLAARRFEDVLALQPNANYRRSLALIGLGRAEEAVAEAMAAGRPAYAVDALLALGRPDEAVACSPTSAQKEEAQLLRVVATADDPERAQTLFAPLARRALDRRDGFWRARLLLVPFILHRGDPTAVRQAWRDCLDRGTGWLGQSPWHTAAYLLGEIDETRWAAQPHRFGLAPTLPFLRALRAELDGAAAAALADYRAYLADPLARTAWGRIEGDPVVDAFARWRVAVLTRR